MVGNRTVNLKISLKTKLISAFLVTTSLVFLLSYFNLQAIAFVRDSFEEMTENYVPRLTALQEMQTLSVKIAGETTLYQAQAAGSDEAERQKNKLLADLEKLSDREKDYLAAADRSENMAEKADMFTAVSTTKQQTVDTVFELVTLKEQNALPADIATKETELEDIEQDLERAIALSLEQDLSVIQEKNLAVDTQIQQTTSLSIAVAVAAGALALILGLGISVAISRNLKKLRDGSARIAAGDFTSQIDVRSNDELGQLAGAFNRMSESLRASYQRLEVEKRRDEAILQNMGEGLIAVNEEGNIVLINQIAADLFDLGEPATLEGKRIYDLFELFSLDKKPLSTEQTPTFVTISSGSAVNDVFGFHKEKEGRQILVNISSSPIMVDGKVAGAIILLRDVTKEREVDRMKTEFISLASHQLRTPLSAIKWFSEMLVAGDAGKLTDDQLDFAKNIAGSTERMIDLVNALLNISRIESGRIMIDPKPTDLNELVGGIVNDLKAKIEEKQQTLAISVHSDLPKINLDPHLIGQVYLNLLTNAIKYTPKGGEISVFVSKKDDQVISQITDNGYGIPKEQQDRVFQKFFRAANAVKVETDGTGLGLYLIKAVIESSGGKIWFESAEDKGTTFWFSIPLSGMKAREGEVTLEL